MSTAYFPQHIAVLIFLCAAFTAASFWALLATGSERAGLARSEAKRVKTRSGMVLTAWGALILWGAQGNLFAVGQTVLGVPTLVLAVGLPVLAGLAALALPSYRASVTAIPLPLLPAFHIIRVFFGILFLAFLELGMAPANFALRGGYGDIAAGLLGALAAYLIVQRVRVSAQWAALGLFSTVGLLDFAIVLYTGLTTITPNSRLGTFYPFQLVPAFVVPLFILTHIFVLRAMLKTPQNLTQKGPGPAVEGSSVTTLT